MFRSKLEERLGKGKLRNMAHEPFKLAYTQTKYYLPDFVNTDKHILFEVKGYFRTSTECRKYIDVKLANPEWDIVFVFSDPNKPLPWAKKRSSDGLRMTHGEWAAMHGFSFCTENSIRKEWL
jgi:hypothetical protein